jgi:glycosyltransferase involved in cell wall biosynthesis
VRGEAERLGVADAVVFAGHHDDPRPCYALADAFLLPSYWEGCSLAVLEAIAADLPLVLADVGDARRQLRYGRGELVAPPFASVTGLDAGNLGRLLGQPDPDHVERLAAAMTRVAAAGPVARRPMPLPFELTRECMASRYRLLFRWLVQGGHPAAVRTLVHRVAADADPKPALEPPADSAIITDPEALRTRAAGS